MTSAHVPASRRVAGTSGRLWAVWCSCGWSLTQATAHPRHAHRQHIEEVQAVQADRLMRQAPRGRRYA